MAVRLTFVGTGDAFASGGRFHTCLHLDGAGEPLLVDCGASAVVALKRCGIDPASVGWVTLSHLHGDHFGGLPFLMMDGDAAGRERPLAIAGPPGTKERLDETAKLMYPGSSGVERGFETRFLELREGEPCELGAAVITPFAACHPSGAPSYTLRMQYGGKVITYSGDTGWQDTLLEAAAGADLFVCECSFFDRDDPYHLNYTTLAAKRAQLDCKRIVLTHFSGETLARLDEVEMETAADGQSIVV